MIVINASVALKFFLPEADSGAALRLLPYCSTFTAPDIFHLEMAAAAAKYHRRRVITIDEARMIEAASRRLVADVHHWQPLLAPPLELALLLHHAVYDCLYLTLAQRLRVPLVTADSVLGGKVAECGLATRIYTPADIDRMLDDGELGEKNGRP